jgi:hypothetical protein
MAHGCANFLGRVKMNAKEMVDKIMGSEIGVGETKEGYVIFPENLVLRSLTDIEAFHIVGLIKVLFADGEILKIDPNKIADHAISILKKKKLDCHEDVVLVEAMAAITSIFIASIDFDAKEVEKKIKEQMEINNAMKEKESGVTTQ